MLGQDWSQNKTTLKCMSHYNRYRSFWKTHHSLWGFMTPPGRCDNIHHDLHQCQAKGLLVGIFFPVENSIVSMRFQIAGRKILSVVCVAPSSSSKYSAFLEKVDQVTSFRGFLGRVPPTDSFMQLGISVTEILGRVWLFSLLDLNLCSEISGTLMQSTLGQKSLIKFVIVLQVLLSWICCTVTTQWTDLSRELRKAWKHLARASVGKNFKSHILSNISPVPNDIKNIEFES